MVSRRFAFVLTALALTLAISCSDKKNKDSGAAMYVNGVAVTQSQIEEFVQVYRAQQMMRSPESVFEGSGGIRAEAARQVAAEMLMLEVVKSMKWEADSAIVETTLNRFIARGPGGREAFEAQLAEMGESEESIRKSIAEGILLDSLVKTISAPDPIDYDDLRAHFEENKERYASPGRARASHIIFMFDPASDSPDQVPNIMKKADEALTKAKAGQDFNELIKAYSSAPGDGDMGWFKKGDLTPEIESVLFGLKKGEISGLVPSSMGIHILKKTDEEESKPVEFDDVSERVKKALESASREKRIKSYMDSLIATANIRYVDSTLVMK